MIEIYMPQDILKYKAKFIANFSAREIGCLAGALVTVGIVNVSFITSGTSFDARVPISVLFAFPWLAFGFIKFYDEPIEKIAPALIYDNFICPLKRYKEIEFPELEKYEKSKPWDVPETIETKKSKFMKTNKKAFVTIPSSEYKPIH